MNHFLQIKKIRIKCNNMRMIHKIIFLKLQKFQALISTEKSIKCFLNSIIKIDINNKLNPLLVCLISLKVSNLDLLRQRSSRVRRYPKRKIQLIIFIKLNYN